MSCEIRDRMQVIKTNIPEVLAFEPETHADRRGTFVETFQAERYASFGLSRPFVQDNLSRSGKDVVRGLHLQNPRCQGRLVSVLRGRVPNVSYDYAQRVTNLVEGMKERSRPTATEEKSTPPNRAIINLDESGEGLRFRVLQNVPRFVLAAS